MKTVIPQTARSRLRAQTLLQSYHAECEANFLRLSRLLHGFESGAELNVALPHRDRRPDFVDLRVIERNPYTAQVEIAQREPPWGAGQRMMMQLRVYLDARMAEVIACQGLRHFKLRYHYPNPQMLAPDEKRQLNHFLGEWLSACLRHGQSTRTVALAAGN